MSGQPLWTWAQLTEALDLPAGSGPDITGIAIDSRQVQPGNLFVALPGDPGPAFQVSQRSERDGHDFVPAAFEAGAAAALVHRNVEGGALLQVADTLEGLWALGRARRAASDARAVAVTGSSGKTTTKSMLSAALGAFATGGSLNNHLGVPISLASTPLDARTAVYEIGTNHPGEIAPLSELAQPDVAVVLNVHPAHAEFFRDRAELMTEKLSIYKGLGDKGHLLIEESLDASALPGSLDVHRFGRNTGTLARLDALDGEAARYEVAGQAVSARVPGGGEHRAMSLCAVLGAMYLLGEPLDGATALGDDLVPRGRGSRSTVAGIELIDDSYNANPASMAAALTQLPRDRGRSVAILGEMLELGEESAAYHRGLADACEGIDLVVRVGGAMNALEPALTRAQRGPAFERADDALLDYLATELSAGDTVLVKGSNRVFWARGFCAALRERLEQR